VIGQGGPAREPYPRARRPGVFISRPDVYLSPRLPLTPQGDTMPAELALDRLRDPALRPIAEKVQAGVRLDEADGLAL